MSAAYDAGAIKVLSEAFAKAMEEFEAINSSVTSTQIKGAATAITAGLLANYDRGERDISSLKTAALMGLNAPRAQPETKVALSCGG